MCDIDVPVLVGLQRLVEALALARGALLPAVDDAGLVEDTPGGRRGHRDDVGVEHHEREPAVALLRVLRVEGEDGLALPVLDPVVARHERVVLVRLAVALLPVVELAALHANPRDEACGRDLGAVGPEAHEVDDLVARVVGNPALLQGSPSSFLA
jgi:hypothetical protein